MADRHQMRTYFSAGEANRIQRYADDHNLTYTQAVRDLVRRGLGEDAAVSASAVLESLLDAILAKHFAALPRVLDRLVFAAIEERQWHSSEMAKLLELTGDRDPASQDQRIAKLQAKITAHVRELTDEFFAAVAREAQEEETLIPDPGEEA